MMTMQNCTPQAGASTLQALRLPLSWRQWIRQGLGLLVRDLRALSRGVIASQRSYMQRHHFAELDDRLLRDAGINPAARRRLLSKRFWT